MRVYNDFFFGTRIQINISWYGSGSGQMIRIRPDPDPKHWGKSQARIILKLFRIKIKAYLPHIFSLNFQANILHAGLVQPY